MNNLTLLQCFALIFLHCKASRMLNHHTHPTYPIRDKKINAECCFVFLTRGWGIWKMLPSDALGSSPQLSTFNMSLLSSSRVPPPPSAWPRLSHEGEFEYSIQQTDRFKTASKTVSNYNPQGPTLVLIWWFDKLIWWFDKTWQAVNCQVISRGGGGEGDKSTWQVQLVKFDLTSSTYSRITSVGREGGSWFRPHSSTRGRSSVVLEVHFRSRSFLKMQIQIEILPCYLHYLDYCTVQRSVVLLVLPCRNTFSNFASITGWSYIQTFFSSDLEGRLLLETKASHQKRKKISGETDIANPTKILST